ncbi:hypothetical protein ACCT30_37470, partial [Rhizobium ruizarguesonis]
MTVRWSFGARGRSIVFPNRRRAADGRERLLPFADIDVLVRRLADSLPFIFVPDEDLAGHKVDRHMFLTLFQIYRQRPKEASGIAVISWSLHWLSHR